MTGRLVSYELSQQFQLSTGADGSMVPSPREGEGTMIWNHRAGNHPGTVFSVQNTPPGTMEPFRNRTGNRFPGTNPPEPFFRHKTDRFSLPNRSAGTIREPKTDTGRQPTHEPEHP